MPAICKCGQEINLVASLDALSSQVMGSSGMFVDTCRGCGETTEIRLRNGGFETGYSYFGGSMHFEAMQRVGVAGLKIRAFDPDDLEVTLGDRRWLFGIRHISHHRFVVFPQAFVAGKQLGTLNFKQWDVSVARVERGAERLDPTSELVVTAGDFLVLSGPAPALNRAWNYMNDGDAIPR